MIAGPWLRKLALTVHVTASVGWIGAVLAYLTLNVVALSSADQGSVRGAYLMLDPVLRFTVVPLAIACLVTGVVQALITRWGLFRHYWVVISLVFTLVAVGFLLAHVPDVSSMSARAADPTADPRRSGADLVHTVGGLLVIAVPLVLNVYKPQGVTRYGRRRRR